jgi:HAE1 family hydrophobic/amphiphilic exporter-1
MEMLGIIVLGGVAVNDAILLVDAARQQMQQGVARAEALARAAGIRLRPILMTTATTVFALLPLAVGTGEAARLRSPLALTIIGGISASTVGSLLVIPCIYLVLDRLRRK